jgi:hypothetical protein
VDALPIGEFIMYDDFDMMAEQQLYPWLDDDSCDAGNVENYDCIEEDYDDSMDGDHESGLASAGWGTDEDYGYYGGNDEY